MAVETHSGQNTAHVSEALDHTGHRIVSVDFVFEIDKALILRRDERVEDCFHRHDAFAHRDLALFAVEVGEIFHVHVEEPRPDLVDGLDNIRAGAHAVPDVDAAAHARVHALHRLQYV